MTHVDNIKVFQPKELQESIGKWYSVPLSDETELVDGKAKRVFYVSKGSSLLTAEYITALLRHYKNIVKFPEDVERQVRADNNIKVWYDLFVINSDYLTDTVSSNILGSKQVNTSGRAGNISKAYFTPYYNTVCLSAIKNLGIGRNSKVLSTYQVNLLKKMKAYVIMDHDNDTHGILLNDRSKDEIDAAIEAYVKEGYTPVRLLFENLPPEQSNFFNIKPISDLISTEVDSEIAKYFRLKHLNAVKMSVSEINQKYGISLVPAFTNNLSNHRFWCSIRHDGELDEIFLIPQNQLYFGFNKDNSDRFHIDSECFVSKSLNKKDNVINIQTKNKKGETYEVDLIELDLYKILERNNYGELRTINTKRPREAKVDLYNYLITNNDKNIKYTIKKAVKTSRIQSDNDSDQKITRILTLACEQPDSTFNLIKSRMGSSSLEDYRINYKNFTNSGVLFEFEDRQTKGSIYTNTTDIMYYFSLHKNNLAYEREKVLTSLFVEHAIRYLKLQGHSNIKIEFEKKVNKQDNSIGYLDLIITSELAGEVYGQVFEFKAWY